MVVPPAVCPPRVMPETRSASRKSARDDGAPGLVSQLAHRLFAHRQVMGLFYRQNETASEFVVVVGAPMTEAIRFLLQDWRPPVHEPLPLPRLRFHVAQSLPPDLSSFQCLFWRSA